MSDEHLTALDAGFLETEDGDGHVSMAIAALSVMEGPPPEFAEVVAILDERSERLPRFRQVLQMSPLDLASPSWSPDLRFDVARHVHRVAVPAPGDDGALFGVVARLMERRLDRSRPLWEAWVLEGLPEGRWAVLTKVHHCVADGVSAAAMLSDVYDTDTDAPADDEPAASASSTDYSSVYSVLGALARLPRTAMRVLSGASQIAVGIALPSRTGLTGPLSDLRSYSAARTSMSDVRLVCKRFGVTVNDVALAAIADGFRAAMERSGIPLGSGPMRALIPVSVRPPDTLPAPDNRVSVLLSDLPVEQADPVERLRLVHRRLATAKRSGQRQAGSLSVAAANLVPHPVMAAAVRLLARLPQHGVATLATNVPGPTTPRRFMGRRILEVLPVPPIGMGLRTGIAITSYAGQLVFGVIGDFDGPIRVDELTAGIEHGLHRLATVARASRRSRRVGDLLVLSG